MSVDVYCYRAPNIYASAPLRVAWTYHSLPEVAPYFPRQYYRVYLTAIYYGSVLLCLRHHREATERLRRSIAAIAACFVKDKRVEIPLEGHSMGELCLTPINKHYRSTLCADRSGLIGRNDLPMEDQPRFAPLSVYAILASNERDLSRRWLHIGGRALLHMEHYYQTAAHYSTDGSHVAATADAFGRINEIERYIEAIMQYADCGPNSDAGYHATIWGFDGPGDDLRARGTTLEEARERLDMMLRTRVEMDLASGCPLPIVRGISLGARPGRTFHGRRLGTASY